MGTLAPHSVLPPLAPDVAMLDMSQREIIVVVDRWPPFRATGMDAVIGIDAEWQGDGNAPLALVQLATPTVVYLVDMLAATLVVKERLAALLADASVLKVGFALNEDCRRLGMPLVNAVDLQEVAVDVLKVRRIR